MTDKDKIKAVNKLVKKERKRLINLINKEGKKKGGLSLDDIKNAPSKALDWITENPKTTTALSFGALSLLNAIDVILNPND